MNMGGPESADKVHSFLLNLFQDGDLIPLPFQKHLSKFIAWRRTPSIIKQYNQIGGGSPIGRWTKTQGEMLESELKTRGMNAKSYTAFRYTQPSTEEALDAMIKDKVKQVYVLSLYPQYSCSTTGSSLNELHRLVKAENVDMTFKIIDRYPTQPKLVSSIEAIEETNFG